MDSVIVTHNSATDLEKQLNTRGMRRGFERVIVVDNASRDDSRWIARACGAEVIARSRNDGLAAAVNAGVRHSDSELVAILNPDVIFDDEALPGQLARAFEAPQLGAVAPSLVLPDGRTQDSARAIPTPVELVKRRLHRRPLGAVEADEPTDVPWLVAAFMVVRRAAFDSVGGFDERFRLYFEDVDFCVRLWSYGWHVRLDPRLQARHEHQASSRRSLVGWPMRQHVRSATRFFAHHPDLLWDSGRKRLVRAPRDRDVTAV